MSVLAGEDAKHASSTSIDPKITGEHMTGTSIMAVAYKGGVVMGADSRTSTGDYVSNRVSDKLTKVHSRMYCCRSGSASDTQALADIVSYYLDMHSVEMGVLPRVHTGATLFQDLIYKNKDRLMAGIIVGGWDPKEKGSVYSITLGGTMVRSPYAIGGSGSTYIYGLVDSEFQPNMDRKQCQNWVKKCLSHAMARDGSSGGIIRLITIDQDGCTRDYVGGEELPFKAEQLV